MGIDKQGGPGDTVVELPENPVLMGKGREKRLGCPQILYKFVTLGIATI